MIYQCGFSAAQEFYILIFLKKSYGFKYSKLIKFCKQIIIHYDDRLGGLKLHSKLWIQFSHRHIITDR